MKHLYKTDITEIKEMVRQTIQDLDLEKKKKNLKDLQSQSIQPDFWNEPEQAKNTLSEIDYLSKEIEEVENLEKDVQELEEMFNIASEEEKEDLVEEYKKIEKKLEEFTKKKYLSGKYDKNNAILSIHAGQGGTEAQDWAEMLLRMYSKCCENYGWEINILHSVLGTEAGITSVTMEIKGRYAYGYLKKETGTHRLVRQSPFNAQNLRQTSFAKVEVIPKIKEVDSDVDISEKDIEFKATRSSGPGGQHVNKTSSAVTLKHIPTGITVHCSEGRDQSQNRKIAMNILKSKLLLKREEEKEKEINKLKGEHQIPGWGTQIRNYVLHPYKLVKDLRTNIEKTDPENVLDGNLDDFLEAQLKI